MITSIAFTVYPVTDMARSRSFYEKVLGLAARVSEGVRSLILMWHTTSKLKT